MSRLEELINELCPNGVEYIKLKEAFNFKNGKGHEQSIDNNGEYIVINAKFISSEGKTIKRCRKQIEPLFVNDITMVMSDLPNGKALAKCFIIDKDDKYSLNQRICALTSIDENKYLPKFYFYFLNRNRLFLKYDNKVDQTNLKKEHVIDINIPVPPLEVQREIVQILDKFTLLTAELTAELTARKQQYEYYRDSLLTFDEKRESLKLSELVQIKNGKDYKHLSEGNIPVYGSGGIMTYVNDMLYNGESVLIPRKGTLTNLFYTHGPIWTVDTIFYTIINKERLLPKYLFYYLQMIHVEKLNVAGGVPSLTQSALNDINLKVPSIRVQKRVVEVLDNFEKICSDLNVGLPAEIEARQKQYEYYREKLLTFIKDDLHLSKQASKIDSGFTAILQYVFGYVNVKFGDVATIVRGASPRPIQSYIVDEGINWIKIGDVPANSKFVTTTKEKISLEGAKKSRFVKKGDFILSNSMSFGRPYILQIDGCIHDGWLSISEFNEFITADYLYHLLSSNEIQLQMKAKASFGGAVSNLNADIVRELELRIPSLKEQQRIVDILDKFDAYCNDASDGLQKEIELRQKQYEYYREKLLKF